MSVDETYLALEFDRRLINFQFCCYLVARFVARRYSSFRIPYIVTVCGYKVRLFSAYLLATVCG
jgi:hypothetical protein